MQVSKQISRTDVECKSVLLRGKFDEESIIELGNFSRNKQVSNFGT